MKKWNKDNFTKKILNPELISPSIGEVSGSTRDFVWEKSLKEFEPFKREAQKWLGRSKRKWVKMLAKRFLLKKATQFKLPIQNYPNYCFPPNTTPTMYAVGQSHLDIAYRWRYLQATEKIRITATKACYHIENVPNFSFSYSQPVMLEWTMHKDPALFERIKAAVKTGRYELVGGSYVEPDTHLISGESWCRQRLYGQLFYRKHFNKLAEIEWVPDSFGFTSTIPQFIKKSGGKYFFTKKMNWNDTTCFPFSIFWWQSPDGSKILTRSLSGSQRKNLLVKWEKYASTALLLKSDVSNSDHIYNYESEELEEFLVTPPKIFSNELIPYEMYVYGFSDGGHGPRGSEVQMSLAMEQMGHIQLAPAQQYFEKVEEEFGDRLPIWRDEMYFEYHRGTYTTSPLLKRMNRYFEWMLPAMERLGVYASLNLNTEFPQAAFDELWKFTLLQQFHDVLPGSNIPEVLDDVWAIWRSQTQKSQQVLSYFWEAITRDRKSILPEKVKSLLKNPNSNNNAIFPIFLFNPHSFRFNADYRVEIPLSKIKDFRNKEDLVILSQEGVSIPFTILKSIPCNKKFYYSPACLSFSMPKNQHYDISTVYLCDRNEIVNEFLDSENINKTDLSFIKNEEHISIKNSKVQLTCNRSTGACSSIRSLIQDKWIEILSQGPQKFRPELPEFNPGIMLQAFYEYSGVYAAWDLFPNSLHYPHMMKCTSTKIISQDHNQISLQIDFELTTPPAKKIRGVNRNQSKKEADQTGRRDPDVNPKFPEIKDYTDKSYFSLIYTVYSEDPKLYIAIKADFNAKETMVKLIIPTSTKATRITSEVAYGLDNRSTVPKTSRDKARWENLMHTWVNVQSSEATWGLGVINDGKYGLGAQQGILSITLIRGKKFPPPFFNIIRKSWVGYERKKRKKAKQGSSPVWTSQGEHIWKFIIYPHAGEHSECDILQQAHLFNSPVLTFVSDKITHSNSSLSEKVHISALPTADYPLEISTIKFPHTDGDAIDWFGDSAPAQKVLILRVINWSNTPVSSHVNFRNLPISNVVECDLLERKLGNHIAVKREGTRIVSIETSWKACEVKTFGIFLV